VCKNFLDYATACGDPSWSLAEEAPQEMQADDPVDIGLVRRGNATNPEGFRRNSRNSAYLSTEKNYAELF
jgi:hypothetical protein